MGWNTGGRPLSSSCMGPGGWGCSSEVPDGSSKVLLRCLQVIVETAVYGVLDNGEAALFGIDYGCLESEYSSYL